MELQQILNEYLIKPATELDLRPRKSIRETLVRTGFELTQSKACTPVEAPMQSILQALGEIVETLHTGSLIIDDIEDNSSWRRGGPTVHQKYGLPTALNAGNWLYFKAFDRIRTLPFTAGEKTAFFELLTSTMVAAHEGQALDLGTRILELTPAMASEISLHALQLKSGKLVAMALQLGGLAAGATAEQLQKLGTMGEQLGTLLQMFDDLGNLQRDPKHTKHLEDLFLLRPSFVWYYLFTHCSTTEQDQFLQAVKNLPALCAMQAFLTKSDFKRRAHQFAVDKFNEFKAVNLVEWGSAQNTNCLQQLISLGESLANAYN